MASPFDDDSVTQASQPKSNSYLVSALKDEKIRGAAISAASNPAVQNAAIAAAKDPRVQQAAISAAKDPGVQAAAADAWKDPKVRSAAGSVVTGGNGRRESGAYVDSEAPVDDDAPGAPIREQPVHTAPPAPVTRVQYARFMFKVCGIPVFLSYSMIILVLADIIQSFRWGGWYLWIVFFIAVDVVLFLSVLLHELAHCAATRCVGGHTSHILLWPLGGLAFVGHGASPKAEIWISLCGPLSHIPQILLWAAIAAAAYGKVELFILYDHIWSTFGRNFVNECCSLQILLFAFNLFLPAFPLDGGRIMAATLIRYYDRQKTATIMMWLSFIIGAGLICWGLIIAQALLTAFTGVWIMYHAFQMWRHKRDGTLDKYPLFLSDGHVAPTSEQETAAQTSV
jgi:Zn-dependent protease